MFAGEEVYYSETDEELEDRPPPSPHSLQSPPPSAKYVHIPLSHSRFYTVVKFKYCYIDGNFFEILQNSEAEHLKTEFCIEIGLKMAIYVISLGISDDSV